MTKECTKCKETKPLERYTRSTNNKSGYHSWCKECMSDKVLEYRGGRVFTKMQKTDTHKQCRICLELLPHSEYSRKNGTYCNKCKKDKDYDRVLRQKGLDIVSYNKLLESQNGVCAICLSPPTKTRLFIDHDHSCCEGAQNCSKCVRGLLCSSCNTSLGLMKDNIDAIRNMLDYLTI